MIRSSWPWYMHAVRKWHQYLSIQPFTILTDQQSLKHLLEQRLFYTSSIYMGYKTHGTEMSVSTVSTELWQEIQAAYAVDATMHQLKQQIINDLDAHPEYKIAEGVVLRKNRVVIPKNEGLRDIILQWLHSSHVGRPFRGVSQSLSFLYHPQSDGQSEVLNRCLEQFLRCMVWDSPQDWLKWLSSAEWWYNTTFHTATGHTPCEILYGQPPPIHLPYIPQECLVDAVNRSFIARELMLQKIKIHLQKATHRMKQQADKHRSERKIKLNTLEDKGAFDGEGIVSELKCKRDLMVIVQ
ncbi:Ribonuclease H-like superfamily [Sesbania bispinosa]|nr:Ribonuclease H-like superfamily [Sesbania bispinosa]